MVRRRISSLVLIAVLISTLVLPTGCNIKSIKSKASAANKKGKIKWLFWDDPETTEDLISKGFKETVDRFNKDYKDKYHCEIITTTVAEYDDKLDSLIASGQCPDVFICNVGARLNYCVKDNVATDLTDIVMGDKEWYNSFEAGMFDSVTYKGNTIKPLLDENGKMNEGVKIRSIPVNFANACMFYNKEIFQKVGIKEPPKTYDELIEICEKLKSQNITPITISAGTEWCLSMLAGYLSIREGGPDNLQKIKEGTGKWTDPSYLRATKKLLELSKYFQKTASIDSNDDATAHFYNEKAAMMIQGSWVIGQMNGARPEFEDKCGICQFPNIAGGTGSDRIISKTDNIVMSTKTKEKDACIALLKYFTDDISQKYTAEVGGKMPVTKVVYDKEKSPKQFQDITKLISEAKGQDMFYNEAMVSTEVGREFDSSMAAIFQRKKTPEQALKDLDAYFEENVWGK